MDSSSVKEHILMDKYYLSTFLGQGGTLEVYNRRNLKTSESVAITVMKKEENMSKNGRPIVIWVGQHSQGETLEQIWIKEFQG